MDLGMRIVNSDERELTPSEIELLKKLIGKFHLSPLVVTQAHRMIDPSLVRVAEWLDGTKRAQTRCSSFAALAVAT